MPFDRAVVCFLKSLVEEGPGLLNSENVCVCFGWHEVDFLSSVIIIISNN